MCGHSEKVGIYKQKRELLPETKLTGALILDSQPPEFWESKFLLLKPASLWYFIMATQEDEYKGCRG